MAVGMTLLTAPLLPLCKGRLPASEQSTLARTNWTFIKKPLFWVFCVSTLFQGLGFFFPALYLPSFATRLGLSSTQGALILAIMAIFQVLGGFGFGYLSDKNVSVSTLAITSSIVATVAIFALWGTAKSLPLLIVFSVVYGFFAYGYGSMRVAMTRAVSDDPSSVVASYAALVFLQGVGNILAGPISSGLISQRISLGTYGIGMYEILVIFAGLCLACSAFVIGLWHLMPRKIRTTDIFQATSV
jgi:MFS family permease